MQAAKVVAEVLQQTPPGANVMLEAGVSEAAVATPIGYAVAAVSPTVAATCSLLGHVSTINIISGLEGGVSPVPTTIAPWQR